LPDRLQDRLAEATRVASKPAGGAGESLVRDDALTDSYREALSLLATRRSSEELGDYLEFGVYTGGTLTCMHRALDDLGLANVRLFGFDSFEGLPEAARTEGDWRPGMYKASLEETTEKLNRAGIRWERTTLVKGWFSETLTDELVQEWGLTKASVVMIDCDIYSSTKAALDFCADLIVDDTIIFFDDWGFVPTGDQQSGEEAAFSEFLEAHPEFDVEELDGCRHHELANTVRVSRRGAA
jgi:hypothetical protein